MPKIPADETVTVRVPKGVPDRVRAATGQSFSRVVRWTVMALLERYEAEGKQQLTQEGQKIGNLVRDMELPSGEQ